MKNVGGSGAEVGDSVRVNGFLKAEKYSQILPHHAVPIREAYDWPQLDDGAKRRTIVSLSHKREI